MKPDRGIANPDRLRQAFHLTVGELFNRFRHRQHETLHRARRAVGLHPPFTFAFDGLVIQHFPLGIGDRDPQPHQHF